MISAGRYVDAHTCFFYTDVDLSLFKPGSSNDERRNYFSNQSLKNINITGVQNFEGRIENYIRVEVPKLI